jgi:hypothetical protein
MTTPPRRSSPWSRRSPRRSVYWLAFSAIALVAAACGGVGSTTGAGGSSTTGTGGSGGSVPPPCGLGAWCPPSCNLAERAFASARIWQISDPQYINIVRDILGVTLSDADAAITGPANTTGEFTNLADNAPSFTSTLALAYQTAAQKVASQASLAANMTRLLGSATPTMAQVTTFVTTKVARLLRRPVTMDEVAALAKIYGDASANPVDGGLAHAFGLMLQAALQWPSFLFRTELGSSTTPATAPFQLTPYELAAAISFALTDSAPDDTLWGKAVNGTLSSPDVLSTEVDRLLALPISQANMTKYVSYWLWIERVPARSKDVLLYPEYTTTLGQALYQSGVAFLKDVVTTGKFSDLFISTKIYLSQEMSAVYGIPGGTVSATLQAVNTALPERSAGILTQPALLAATNKRPSQLDPIDHGLFVWGTLLDGADVGPIPIPPPHSGPGDPPLDPPFTTQRTDERQLADRRATIATCNVCHGLFDGYGLTRSRYDSIGRYSETRYVAVEIAGPDTTYVWATSPTPLDTSATIPDTVGPDLKGLLADTAALARQLNSAAVRRRIAYSAAKNLTLYVMGHDASRENSCALQNVKEEFYQTGSFTAFFKSLLTSPGFSTRDPG